MRRFTRLPVEPIDGPIVIMSQVGAGWVTKFSELSVPLCREAVVDQLPLVLAQVHVLEKNQARLWMWERSTENLGLRALDVNNQNVDRRRVHLAPDVRKPHDAHRHIGTRPLELPFVRQVVGLLVPC